MKKSRAAILVVLALVLSQFSFTQTDSQRSVTDSSLVVSPIVADSLGSSRSIAKSTTFRKTKSPWLAVGLSAIAPGAGQLYNENYWKPPVIWGLGGYWVYEWVHLNNKYRDFRDSYNESLVNSTAGNPQFLKLRDFYHDERDKFAWFLGALYFLNLVDAYVGAHLYDFDVSPDLTFDGRIVPKVTASVRFHF